ncbi:MAG: DUF4157 domain-containing protein [Saprospiraceae bacterium]|nr:DUF4157 domain-containing protein [Saprospiraceae bacterium]
MKSIFQSNQRSRRNKPNPQNEQLGEQQPFFGGQGEPFIQPKLTVGQPDDAYEREADAVAENVVSTGQQSAAPPAVQKMPITPLQSGSLQRLATPEEDKMPSTNDERMAEDKRIQEKTEPGAAEEKKEEPVQMMTEPEKKEEPVQMMTEPEKKEEPVQMMEAPEKKEELQTKTDGQTGSHTHANLSTRLSSQKGGGEPLPDAAKTQMEQGIGTDFSDVRIHTDSEAEEMNKDLHAQAFTHGKDIYFNSGKFNPESKDGQKLLAHELTHVVQQGGGQGEAIQREGETPLIPRAGSVKSLTMVSGKTYIVRSDDTTGDIWENIHQKTGILPINLKLFNMVFKGISEFFTLDWYPEMSEGKEIYIPSGDEIAFSQYLLKFKDYETAVQEFGKSYAGTPQQAVLNAGITRTTGSVGEFYGNADPSFYSPNTDLAGAKPNNKTTKDGQTEYKINWSSSTSSEYWKCNIFVNDAVYQAGYKPATGYKQHYKTAGNMHTSDNLTQIEVSGAIPGTIIQYFGGTSSDASHTMILTSFISVENLPDGKQKWTFNATGGEGERAAESARELIVDPTYSDGYTLHDDPHGWTKTRFFIPANKR